MNIIYLHTHDIGRYVQPYGYPPNMPNLQRLAEEGVLFRNAFSAAPTCSPSRAALLTGQYPHQCGMFGLTNQGWLLNDYSRHLAGFLGRQGYETALAGIQHVTGVHPDELRRLPYDHFLTESVNELTESIDQGPPKEDVTTEQAAAFIKAGHDAPFFLTIGYGLTHHKRWDYSFCRSRDALGPLDCRYARPLPHLPDTPATRWEAAMHYRAAEYLDLHIGRILAAVDEAGIADDTLLFFTTDHGPGLPGVKVNLNDRGCGVALIMRGPRGFSGGKVLEGLAHHIDLYPTFCEMLDLAPPPWTEGRSLLPMVRGETGGTNEMIFNEQNYHGAFVPLRSVRTERYRYVRRIGEAKSALRYSADGGCAYDFLEEHGLDEVLVPEEQLFDLALDPNELVNVAGREPYADALIAMRGHLDEWLARTDDPFRTHSIPEPPGQPPWDREARPIKEARRHAWIKRREELQALDARDSGLNA